MWKIAMTGAAVLVLGAGAWSQENTSGTEQGVERVRITDSREFLRRFDKNHNGKVEKTEWSGPSVQFLRMDANNDKVLEGWEINLAHLITTAQIRNFVMERDKDKTGGLSIAELPASATTFRLWDFNGDRQIAVDELGRAVKGMHAEERQPMDMEARRAAARERAAPRRVETAEQRILRRWDVDGDGRISRTEFQGSTDMWEQMDADRDGYVAPSEISSIKSQIRTTLSVRLGGMDKDGDGRIARSEYPGAAQTFRQLDINGDGFLDAADHPPETVEITSATPEVAPPVVAATAVLPATEVMPATGVKPATP